MIVITYQLRSGNTYTEKYGSITQARETCDFIEHIGGKILKVVII